ncbi:UDP-N-acetylmuramoyl-L-alanine--D-glutamate ligase, partial [Microcoleus sp. HI-ES]|nr:UDP-N-acetylmuramoyl-L-alanine--D-glutamate ligase [Microcoleus sp. HI-ES]MCZ0904025.1 UDP-N-acetylmuramoyl-L-alanine--D-glutamate ligase [Microcoleus sp. HI-ES]
VDIWPDACWTSVKGEKDLLGNTDFGAYIQDGWVIAQCEKILPADSLRMVGEHNLQNLLMAVAAAHLAGIDKSAIAQAILKLNNNREW